MESTIAFDITLILLKGGLQCKTTQKGVKERQTISLSCLTVFFKLITQLKDLSHFLGKVVLLACRSVRKRNKTVGRLSWEENRIARRRRGRGIRLAADVERKVIESLLPIVVK